jgi:hypothetical protein
MIKFNKIRLIGFYTIDLPIQGALPTDRYICESVDGLGPTDGGVSVARTLFQGGIYQGRRPVYKQIVAKIKLNSSWSNGETAAQLRDELYGLITTGPSQSVEIQLLDGNVVVAVTTGYVDKFEIVPFAKEPKVQITFETTSAYLEAPVQTVIPPKNGPSLTVNYVGTAEAEFYQRLTLSQSSSFWQITQTNSGRFMRLNGSFAPGDEILLDTRAGSRGIQHHRPGVFIVSALNLLTSDSDWLILYRGANEFVITGNSSKWTEFYFKPRYLGV